MNSGRSIRDLPIRTESSIDNKHAARRGLWAYPHPVERDLRAWVSRMYRNSSGVHKFFLKTGNLRLEEPLPTRTDHPEGPSNSAKLLEAMPVA